MELSDYDILGISPKATFRQVKNAYYELVRLYHPDSNYFSKIINKEEKESAILKLNTAYENIKKKLNITEIDLPKENCDYKPLQVNKTMEINNFDKNILEKFNKNFEIAHSYQSADDPFSIYYKEPEKQNQTKYSTELIYSSEYYKIKNPYEFGVNYIYDHSSDIYTDINHIKNENKNENENENENNETLSILYDKMLKERDIKIELAEDEKEFITRQNKLNQQILNSKNKIFENQNKLLLN